MLCVRWYPTYTLSYRDLREMMAERGVPMAHTTILRWVQRYVPEFEKRWRRYARPVGSSWRVDETYITVKGRWTYLYRAVDEDGLTVDFLLNEYRDVAAAKGFSMKAIKRRCTPDGITLDGDAASHRGVAWLQAEGVVSTTVVLRANRYLNNPIEQHRRRVKQRVRPMLGFKVFETAGVRLRGIELMQQIRKGQIDLVGIGRGAVGAWETVLAA